MSQGKQLGIHPATRRHCKSLWTCVRQNVVGMPALYNEAGLDRFLPDACPKRFAVLMGSTRFLRTSGIYNYALSARVLRVVKNGVQGHISDVLTRGTSFQFPVCSFSHAICA